MLGGSQNQTHTSVIFSRSWQTCDPQDHRLTVRLFLLLFINSSCPLLLSIPSPPYFYQFLLFLILSIPPPPYFYQFLHFFIFTNSSAFMSIFQSHGTDIPYLNIPFYTHAPVFFSFMPFSFSSFLSFSFHPWTKFVEKKIMFLTTSCNYTWSNTWRRETNCPIFDFLTKPLEGFWEIIARKDLQDKSLGKIHSRRIFPLSLSLDLCPARKETVTSRRGA